MTRETSTLVFTSHLFPSFCRYLKAKVRILGSIFRVDAMAIGKLVGTLKTKSRAGTWKVRYPAGFCRNHRLADACGVHCLSFNVEDVVV